MARGKSVRERVLWRNLQLALCGINGITRHRWRNM